MAIRAVSCHRSVAAPVPNEMPNTVTWAEDGAVRRAHWHSEGGWPAPTALQLIDERFAPTDALRLASGGIGLLWRGDYHAAKRMLTTLGAELDRTQARRAAREPRTPATRGLTAAFHRHRETSFERARVLGMLLVPLDADHAIPLDRAPDVRAACAEAYGDPAASGVTIVSLRELLGVIGAHEWRERGVPVAALGGDRIHPHYGVFSPVRGEYLDLVARAPLPPGALAGRAFDIGTGTGVLAAILARRGIPSIVATDLDPRSIACAQENLGRLGVAERVSVQQIDLFPPGRADLIVCNPPWLPAPARVGTDHAVYDPDSRMLRSFIAGLPGHLPSEGEGWLIISDLAERLGLRSRGELLDHFDQAGLEAVGRLDARPSHSRVFDAADPLHAARAAEITSLWRLRHATR